jgi:predicted acetyltransferase
MLIALTPVTNAERGALENLFQLYVHDFSEHWSGTERGELDDDGRFAPYPLDPYFDASGDEAFFVRVDGHLAGFALLNRVGHVGAVDHNVAELFVVRKHRRAGVAGEAIATLLDGRPGRWETAVARRNTSALAFWRRTLGAHARVRDIDEHDLQPPVWNGLVLRFEVG